jgi:hypothetical protein
LETPAGVPLGAAGSRSSSDHLLLLGVLEPPEAVFPVLVREPTLHADAARRALGQAGGEQEVDPVRRPHARVDLELGHHVGPEERAARPQPRQLADGRVDAVGVLRELREVQDLRVIPRDVVDGAGREHRLTR